jgi:phage gpG-like protein
VIKYPPLLSQYDPKRSELLNKAEAVGITQARLLARKDTGILANSIEEKRRTDDTREYGSNVDYAAAQEYGLAEKGKPNYGYTPYLRPSALKIIQRIAVILRSLW